MQLSESYKTDSSTKCIWVHQRQKSRTKSREVLGKISQIK